MKKTLLLVLVFNAMGFTLAAAAYRLGYLPFDVLTSAGVAGALFVAALTAFACTDYRRRRAFRVRRPKPDVAEPESAIPPPDWTYTTRT